ncbi:MAG: dihydroxyacetone kinase subunit DhaL [Oscillospiraceae bacterium]|nr:dihydroxyacetone kinase subunit DhaL [Oscillospiraceae bacterium]
MAVKLTSADYVAYLKRAYEKLHSEGDYITDLDLATGDGDHWTNMDTGFERLIGQAGELEKLPLAEAFQKISMTLMTVIGGSGGILYASAYMEAAKRAKGLEALSSADVCNMLEGMEAAIMNRGKSKPGDKTMLDTLDHAVRCYKECLSEGKSEAETFKAVKAAAETGAESTREMPAVRGRAYYQANKGVGHLDPGAVTMCYQIQTLMDCMIEKT